MITLGKAHVVKSHQLLGEQGLAGPQPCVLVGKAWVSASPSGCLSLSTKVPREEKKIPAVPLQVLKMKLNVFSPKRCGFFQLCLTRSAPLFLSKTASSVMYPGRTPCPLTLGTSNLLLGDFWSPIRAPLPGMPAALLALCWFWGRALLQLLC